MAYDLIRKTTITIINNAVLKILKILSAPLSLFDFGSA
jgi:uncharacterized membrane protein YvlD (DUF360 family)